jgi:hypothetical protein
MDPKRLGYGILFLIAASIVLAVGYKTAPKANACNATNSASTRTSQSPRCPDPPDTGYLVIAGALGGIGLLITAPWWLRWLGGSKPGGF